MSTPYFILASGSPRRREFMQLLSLPFTVLTPAQAAGADVDEAPLPGESPAALVQRLSRVKAETVAVALKQRPDRFLKPVRSDYAVIAADTVVVLGDKILGKPQHPAEATQMLKDLRDQAHEVYSGLTVVSIRSDNSTSITRLHQSTVWMRPYTDAEIAVYVSTGDPLDKAGAYGIQNKEFNPVARLAGCFASVMGLPLGELAAALRELGINLPDIGPLCAGFTGQKCCQ
jgi:septum formation protein